MNILMYLIIFLLQGYAGLSAYILDGSVTPTIIHHMYQFNDGDIARGSIDFKKGFNIPPGAGVAMDLWEPVNGPINLNTTGTVTFYSPLKLGPKCPGFPQGGRFYIPFQSGLVIILSNDITIGGQMEVHNPTGGGNNFGLAFVLQGHNLYFADDGISRGSLLLVDDVALATNSAYTLNSGNSLNFGGGTIFGLQDFTTGYGPKIRFSEGFQGNPTVWLGNTVCVLGADSTMTATGYAIQFPGGVVEFRTPSKATVNALGGSYIYTEGSLILSPGITYSVPGYLNFNNPNYTSMTMNNATLKTPFFLAGSQGGPVIIKGRSYIQTIDGSNGSVIINSLLDITSGASLVSNNMSFVNGATI